VSLSKVFGTVHIFLQPTSTIQTHKRELFLRCRDENEDNKSCLVEKLYETLENPSHIMEESRLKEWPTILSPNYYVRMVSNEGVILYFVTLTKVVLPSWY
jgi:hypothetical protein